MGRARADRLPLAGERLDPAAVRSIALWKDAVLAYGLAWFAALCVGAIALLTSVLLRSTAAAMGTMLAALIAGTILPRLAPSWEAQKFLFVTNLPLPDYYSGSPRADPGTDRRVSARRCSRSGPWRRSPRPSPSSSKRTSWPDRLVYTPRPLEETMKLDPRQSHYVLQALLAQRKVGARHVRAILEEWRKEIAALRQRLATLEELGVRGAEKAGRRVAVKAGRAEARVQRRLSPKVRALRRQQGQYMGLVRRLKPGQKATRARRAREKGPRRPPFELALSLSR